MPQSAQHNLTALVRLRNAAVGGLLCLLFTLCLIHSYVFPLNSVTVIKNEVANDQAHMIWSLWLVNESISSGRSPFKTDLIYWPVGADLSRHTLVLGFFPVTFLTKAFSGSDLLYPLYAFHLIILLSFALTLGCSYLLLRELAFTRLASAMPAIAFSFSDFSIEHALHLHLSTFLFPLMALALVRLYRQQGSANLAALAVLASVAVFFTELVVYLLICLPVFLALLLIFRAERQELLIRSKAIGIRRAMLALCICAAIVGPFAIKFIRSQTTPPSVVESSQYSANAAGFIVPNGQRTPLYDGLFAKLDARVTAGIPGYETFMGFPLLIAGVVGIATERRTAVRALAVAALFAVVLSLGPTLKILGTDTGVALPYRLLMQAPLLNQGRTPVRFVAVAMFFVMIIAASGLAWLQTKLRRRHIGPAVAVCLLLWTIGEAYTPALPHSRFTIPKELSNVTSGPVLNLPLSLYDGDAAMWQVFHHQPIATGYTRNSIEQIDRVDQLEKLLDRDGWQLCEVAAKLGFRNIIVAPVSQLEAPFDPSRCSLNVIDLRGPAGDLAVYQRGSRIDFSTADADRYLPYGWSNREAISRWSDHARAIVALKVERAEAGTLRIKLAPFLAPGKLEAQRVEIKLNGQALQPLMLKDARFEEFTIAIPNGVLKRENILSFTLPDANSPRSTGVGEDLRLLGINVQWIEID